MAFPVNVPNVPGVPSVSFASIVSTGLSLLSTDGASVLLGLLGFQQWGIYLAGAPIVLCDNVVSVDYRQQWNLSDYPVEEGAFETYDKVSTPFEARVRFSAGGSASNREALLASIAAIAGNLLLYDVVTPETVHSSCNITHYDYSRSAERGAGLIVIDVWLEEVRVTAGMSTQGTQDPGASPQVNTGPVQATTPSAAQTAKALPFNDGNKV